MSRVRRTTPRVDRKAFTIASMVVTLISITWSLVGTPLMSDDALVRADFRNNGESVISQIGTNVAAFVRLGRLNIFNHVQSAVLLKIDIPVWGYRALQIAALALVLFLFRGVVLQLLKRPDVATVATLFFLLVLELRRYHDPIRDFHGLALCALACFLGAVLVTLRNTEGTLKGLVFAGLLWTAALLYYEINFSLVPVWLLLTLLAAPKAKRFLFFLSWSVPLVTVAGLTVLARSQAASGYSGVQPSFRIKNYIYALISELSSTAPYSYRLVGDRLVGFGMPTISPLTVIAAVGAATTAWLAFGDARSERRSQEDSDATVEAGSAAPDRRTTWLVLGMSFSLIVSPAVMIAASAKYQDELRPGLGYIPVLFQHAGLALFVGLVYSYIRGSLVAKPIAIGAAVTMFGAMGFVTSASWSESAASLVPTKVGRELFETSVSSGMWSDVREGSTVSLTTMNWSADARDIARLGGPKVTTVPKLGQSCPCPPAQVTVIALGDRSGRGVLLIANDNSEESQLLVRGSDLASDLLSGKRTIRFADQAVGKSVRLIKTLDNGDRILSLKLPSATDETTFSIDGLERLRHYT